MLGPVTSEPPGPRFACDAMLKGLARLARAWGYDAFWRYGIDDAELLDVAEREDRIVVTADRELAGRRRARAGRPPVLLVEPAAPPIEQWRDVVDRLDLPLGEMRCLACGGFARRVPHESVRGQAPPRSFAAFRDFRRCVRCGRLLWPGTHYERIRGWRRLPADGEARTEDVRGRSPNGR